MACVSLCTSCLFGCHIFKECKEVFAVSVPYEELRVAIRSSGLADSVLADAKHSKLSAS